MIQDGVRPFVDDSCSTGSQPNSTAEKRPLLPALPVSDTIKRGDSVGLVTGTVPRNDLYAAQTPQSFHYETILAAHERAATAQAVDFTDDASIAEWAGIPVQLVQGSIDNVKLTVQRDLTMADEKLKRNALPDVRTGTAMTCTSSSPAMA